VTRADYDRARRNARAARPADPQSGVHGGPAALAAVQAMSRPCAAPAGGGVCGDSGFLHNTGTRDGQPARTACTVATGDGPCGCTSYRPSAGDLPEAARRPPAPRTTD
jgi:hypothetical protein